MRPSNREKTPPMPTVYRLLNNNCEHFCEWCLRAEHRTYQVDEWLSRPHRALRMTVSCVELRTTMFLDHMQRFCVAWFRDYSEVLQTLSGLSERILRRQRARMA
jgi:hypothetical protein